MAELNKRSHYRYLWKILRNKYYPSSTPIYLIEGRYPVPYEAGYNWVVGYCPTLILAERTVLKLKNELKEARRYLGPYSKIEHILYAEYNKTKNIAGWAKANNKLRELIDMEVSKMTDQNIPFPYSHIMSSGKHDGPIIYRTRAIYDI